MEVLRYCDRKMMRNIIKTTIKYHAFSILLSELETCEVGLSKFPQKRKRFLKVEKN